MISTLTRDCELYSSKLVGCKIATFFLAQKWVLFIVFWDSNYHVILKSHAWFLNHMSNAHVNLFGWFVLYSQNIPFSDWLMNHRNMWFWNHMLVPVSLYSNSQADMELHVINCTLLIHHLLKSSLLIGWHTFTCGVPCGVPCGVTSDWLVTWDSHIQTKEMSAYLRSALLNEISTCGWLCTVVYSNIFTCSYLWLGWVVGAW